MRTSLCDLLDIEYAVLLAGMGGAANAELAAAVSEAGIEEVAKAKIIASSERDTRVTALTPLETGTRAGLEAASTR